MQTKKADELHAKVCRLTATEINRAFRQSALAQLFASVETEMVISDAWHVPVSQDQTVARQG